MQQVIGLIIVIVIISAVVGMIAQFLNRLGEMNTPDRRRPQRRRPERRDDEQPAAAPERPRSADRDMDRFLAEIDRLRRKNTGEPTAAPPPPMARPVERPQARPADKPRARVVAELAEPTAAPSRRVEQPPQTYTPHAQPVAAQIEQLPLAQVVAPSASTGAPATRVTRLSARSKAVPKSDFAKNLFNLLGSPQGVAIAVVVQEVLGPPKAKRT